MTTKSWSWAGGYAHRYGNRVYVTTFNLPNTVREAEAIWEKLLELAGGKPCTWLMDVRADSIPPTEVRARMTSLSDPYFKALAIVSHSSLMAFFGKMMLKLRRANYPMQFFAKGTGAEEWLRQFDDQKPHWTEYCNQVNREQGYTDKYEIKHLGNGIILIRFPSPVRVDEELIKRINKQTFELSKDFGGKLSIIGQLQNIKSATKNARKEATKVHWVKKLALIPNSNLERFIGNFYIKVNKPAYPTKMLATVDEAHQWIQNDTTPFTQVNSHLNLDMAKIQDLLTDFGNHDFKKRLDIGSIVDPNLRVVAEAINVLGDEFEHSVVSKNELENQKNFYEAVIDNVPSAMCIKDATNQFSITYCNRAAETLTGLSKAAILGKAESEIMPPDSAQLNLISDREVMKSGKMAENIRIFFETPDKGTRIVNVKKVPITVWDNERQVSYLIQIGDDITQQLELTEEVKKNQILAYSSNKMATLGEMAAGIAHEINNPLEIIRGKSKLMKILLSQPSLTDSDRNKINEHVDIVQETIARIAAIIRGLKSFSRNTAEDPFNLVSVKKIVDDTLVLCSERVKNRGIDFKTTSVDPELSIECRETEVSQVLINLIANSLDAVEDRDEKWIELIIKTDQNNLEISVRDSGTGIPSELREKIFEPFFTTKAAGKGTGLGLPISREIIRRHNGDLKLGPPNDHTEFKIILPLRQGISNERKTA